MCLPNCIAAYRMKIYPYLSLCTILNSKCIRDVNVRPCILNLIEEKVENSYEFTGKGNDLLNRTLIAQVSKPTINKLVFV